MPPRISFPSATFLLLLLANACAVEPDDPVEALGSTDQDIQNGAPISATNSGYVLLGTPDSGCSGTLMANAWVLTARHCVSAADVAAPSRVSASMGSQTTVAAQIALYPNDDVALIRLAMPLTMNGSPFGFRRHLYPFATNTIAAGTNLTCRGFGVNDLNAGTGFGTLRLAVLPVRGVHFTWWGVGFDLGLDMNAAGQFLAPGDSGSSCLLALPSGEEVVTGVTSTLSRFIDATINNLISAETFRAWFTPFEGLWTPSYPGLGAPSGGVTSGPAVASMGAGRLDVFARGTDNAIWTTTRFGGLQTPWGRIAANAVSSDPAAISWGPNRMDVVARGMDNAYHIISWTGTAWNAWSSLGGSFNSGPAIASRGAGLLDVFGRGTDNAVWMRSWNGSSWSGWSQIAPNAITFEPAAIASGPNRIDLFATGTDGQMYTNRFTGGAWTGWTGLGGGFTSGPTVASSIPGQLELYGRGADGALYVNTFLTSWTGWRQVAPNGILGDPAAVSPPASVRTDVAVRGVDNNVYLLETSGF